MYRVAWKNKITGQTGHGDWSNDYNLINAWVKEANKTEPNIFHWIEKKIRPIIP